MGMGVATMPVIEMNSYTKSACTCIDHASMYLCARLFFGNIKMALIAAHLNAGIILVVTV